MVNLNSNSDKDSNGNNNNNTKIWIYVDGQKSLATPNLDIGHNVYGERLIQDSHKEFRQWDAYRSKLAAAIHKGIQNLPFVNGTRVLYLGASTGTTVSHISDIVGNGGIVFAVEPAIRVARELLENVATRRYNIIPIVEDGRKPRSYYSIFGTVQVVYCDIAQPDQTDIAIENCRVYLERGGVLLLVVKSRSIDVVKAPKVVIKEEAQKLESNGFMIKQVIDLEPYDKDHGMIYAIFARKDE
ncbi:MAG TPA: fibrillarin-like rRNA/tRNA 2'-O-methyltransferase [Nitrososphaeraceae archaeon]|nr:fibrillarin-like rRNA/tRNA 2'-O-methyltransferase [Nitrososphaeraceae archaeon]